MKPNKKNQLENYIIACTNFYGIIREDQLKKIYFKHHNEPIDLSNIDHEYLNHFFIHYKFQYFMVEVFFEEDMISNYIGKMNHKPIYYPTKKELMNYLDDSYIEMNKYIKAFIQYVNEHTPKNKEIHYQNFIDEVLFSQNIGFDLDRLDNVRVRNRAYELKEQEVLPLVADVCEHVRLWINNGHTNDELTTINQDNPNIDFLDYGDIQKQLQEYKEQFKHNIRKLLVKVPIDIYIFTNPGLNDLVDYVGDELFESLFDEKAIHILAALIRIVYEKNELKFTDKRKEYYYHALGVWTHKEEVDRIYEYLDGEFEQYDIEHYQMYLNRFYEAMGHKPMTSVTKEDVRKLFYNQKNLAVNPKVNSKLLKLTELIVQADEDPFTSLYNLCYIYPLSTDTLYNLVSYGEVKYQEILLKAVIQSFEISYPKLLETPNTYKKRNISFRIYLLALKGLGLIYKEKNKMDEALKLFQRMLYCDNKDTYDAKASILICYIHLNKYDEFGETLEQLSDDHMVKHILSVVDLIEKGQSFDEYYRDVVLEYKHVFKHLLLGYDYKDQDLTPNEREFIEDFGYLFKQKPALKNELMIFLSSNTTA